MGQVTATADTRLTRRNGAFEALRRALGDVLRIFWGEAGQALAQIAIPAIVLLLLAGAAPSAVDEAGRILRFDKRQMIGPPLAASGAESAASATSAASALLDPAVWRNRFAFLWPSLLDTSLLVLWGLAAATAFSLLLVAPALRARGPGVRAFFAALGETGLALCCVPIFVAGFLIRIKVPYESRALYYALAAISLGVGNLTLAEMTQMLRASMEDEMRLPYFNLIDARGFSPWRRWMHRVRPWTRAALLSLRSKVPILFSSVVIIEIILSLPLGGRSPIEKGLGLVAKEAAEAGDAVTLLWVIVVVAVWIRLFSFFAQTVSYFWLWNAKSE